MLNIQRLDTCLWETADNIAFPHGFMSRAGGISTGIYEGLNCGPGSNDDTANVMENRRIVSGLISKRRDTPLVTAYQFHSNQAIYLDKNWGTDRPKADGIVTNQPGLLLGILTADCTPVLFADAKNQIIGAAHAGWKGAFTGIIEATIEKMETIGGSRSNITASIGPTIHQKSYEVSANFLETFLNQNNSFDRFFVNGVNNEHYQFNLPAFVAFKLEEAGIKNISQSSTDTYTSPDHFSYRRTTHKNESDYGRQVSTIMIP
jgi:YfiH family protein